MDKKIAVVFDLDDTLYSKSEVFFNAFCQFAAPTIDTKSLYLTYQKRSDEAFEKFSSGKITLSQSHQERVANTFKDVGIELSSEKILAFITA